MSRSPVWTRVGGTRLPPYDRTGAGVRACFAGFRRRASLRRGLAQALWVARRYSLRFALLLLDIDRLREVNERLGQAGGDRVLAEFGAVMQREIRAPDFVARYGGDEFALILPETGGEGGRPFVGRLRQVLNPHTFPHPGPGDIPALSAGVVAFPHSEALRPEDLFSLTGAPLDKGKKDAPD